MKSIDEVPSMLRARVEELLINASLDYDTDRYDAGGSFHHHRPVNYPHPNLLDDTGSYDAGGFPSIPPRVLPSIIPNHRAGNPDM